MERSDEGKLTQGNPVQCSYCEEFIEESQDELRSVRDEGTRKQNLISIKNKT